MSWPPTNAEGSALRSMGQKYIRVEEWSSGMYGNYGEINGIRAMRRLGVVEDHFNRLTGQITGSDGDTIAMVQSFGRDFAGSEFATWAALGEHGTAPTWLEAKARADGVLRKAGLIK